MADKTHIEWTDATWHPVTGCSKVSAGCKHCYAERDWVRLSANPATRYYGRNFTDVQCHKDMLDLPLRWKRPRRIFVNSMSDLFHPDVPIQFLEDVMTTMELARHHTFQVLTKRPAEMLDKLQRIATPVPSNVWLGVSIEDQATADTRIPLLLQAPAAVRWISAEPLLGPVDLRRLPEVTCGPHIDWVVVGGESGPNARPMQLELARDLRNQCDAAGVPLLFKQWGEHWPAILDRKPHEEEPWRITPNGVRAWNPTESMEPAETWPTVIMKRFGKKVAGRLLDGVEHNGYPQPST